MPTIIASSMKEAKELVNARKYREIVLNFDVDADDFFTLATAQHDTKITFANKNSHSPVTLEK